MSVTFTSIIPREASHPRSEIIFFFEIHIMREMYVNVRERCRVPVRRFSSPSRSIHFAWTTRPETLWPRGIMRPRDYGTWTVQRGRNTTQIHMQLATPQSMTSPRLPSRYMIYLAKVKVKVSMQRDFHWLQWPKCSFIIFLKCLLLVNHDRFSSCK